MESLTRGLGPGRHGSVRTRNWGLGTCVSCHGSRRTWRSLLGHLYRRDAAGCPWRGRATPETETVTGSPVRVWEVARALTVTVTQSPGHPNHPVASVLVWFRPRTHFSPGDTGTEESQRTPPRARPPRSPLKLCFSPPRPGPRGSGSCQLASRPCSRGPVVPMELGDPGSVETVPILSPDLQNAATTRFSGMFPGPTTLFCVDSGWSIRDDGVAHASVSLASGFSPRVPRARPHGPGAPRPGAGTILRGFSL